MLCSEGVSVKAGESSVVRICNECADPLGRGVLPKFSLKNGLFRGHLPSHLQDITWVEEMVCARYRCTAHVERLFKSKDPRNPFIFYGNTCAHPQNVVKTANVLPRSPGDINDTIAVLFVGPGQYKPDILEKVFRVRRQKIIDFLVWLCANNRLYDGITIDHGRFQDFPVDGMLPGIQDRII
ncbi:hypothetical protein EXIGLDRAFT_629852, partial [Exidia glandulosa HHB12029]